MGTCLGRCFGISASKRKYLRTRYSVERDMSIEFENLMDDDMVVGRKREDDVLEPLYSRQDSNVDEMSRLVTENEKRILSSKQYTELLHEQKRLDREIDKKLAQQEEELRQEEEKFYEAKREAARSAKLQQQKAKNSKSNKSWLGDENEWHVAGGEDDFEMFLANVKARSFKATAHLRQGSGDGQSSNSSTQTRDRSQTEGSSLDLEWEHEEGMSTQKKVRSGTEENLVTAYVHKSNDSPVNSNDFEWDDDYVSADLSHDTQQLLAAERKIQEYANH